MADCDMPVYWIVSPSLSGLNLDTVIVSMPNCEKARGNRLLDGKFSRVAILTDCLVDPSISTTADEPDHFIAIKDMDFALVTTYWSLLGAG